MRELFRRSRANAIARNAAQPVVLVSPAAAIRERSPRPAAPTAIVCPIDKSSEACLVADFAAALATSTLTRLVLVYGPSSDDQGPIEERPTGSR
jgi:hypothetical protein